MTKLKNMKKWQKILIMIILAVIIFLVLLITFRKQVLSILLNDKELAVYDCCCKTKRAAKEKGVKAEKYNCAYVSDSERGQTIFIYIYSQTNAMFSDCNANYNLNTKEIDYMCMFLADKNVDYNSVSLNDSYVSLSIINQSNDDYTLSNNDINIIHDNFYVSYSDIERTDELINNSTEALQMAADSKNWEGYTEINGIKSILINLFC